MKKIAVPAIIGLVDASYLTYEHYSDIIPPCTNSFLADCGKVLQSQYALVFGVPLAGIGVFYYSLLLIVAVSVIINNNRIGKYAIVILTTGGFVSSLYFVFLQLFVIKAICIYCMLSAIVSTILFIITHLSFGRERQILILNSMALVYRFWVKKMLFTINPELVHTSMTNFGEQLGKNFVAKQMFSQVFVVKHATLKQTIAGIIFQNPIGLAAGFDYEAKLTQILPNIGFGFQSVGTITNMPYEGNPKPLLGRLPQSKSLMVNKGFKNLGAYATVKKLYGLSFHIPVGISIGRTNTGILKTQNESIDDILKTFIRFEKSRVHHSYYELNISCPNLYGDITFYSPKNLKELLTEIDGLHLKRPVFIKMPIEKSNAEVLEMMRVIVRHSPKGIIIGNLQKNRKDPAFVQQEVQQFTVGNFSGKPTFNRSNELIKLVYKNYKERIVIIGCGGVFSGADAYQKVTLGASLIQLITGMIFQGPQLISQINLELIDALKKDGLTHISEAVGLYNKGV